MNQSNIGWRLLCRLWIVSLLAGCSGEVVGSGGGEDVGEVSDEISLQTDTFFHNFNPDVSLGKNPLIWDHAKDERPTGTGSTATAPRCWDYETYGGFWVMVGFDQWDNTNTIACRHINLQWTGSWSWGDWKDPQQQSVAEAGANNERLWTCMDASHPLSGGKWSVAVGYNYGTGKPICRELSTTGGSTYNSERHESATDGNNLVLFNAYQHFGYTHDMHVCKNWADGGNGVILGGLKAFSPFAPAYRIRCGK